MSGAARRPCWLQGTEIPSRTVLFPLDHPADLLVTKPLAGVFQPIGGDDKDDLFGTFVLRQMTLDIHHLFHAVTDGIQQRRTAPDVVVLFGQRRNSLQRKTVVQQLHLMVEQDGGHVGLALLLLLPGQHSIEPADGVRFQSAHGAAAVEDKNKLCKILLHNKCPPFFVVFCLFDKRIPQTEGRKVNGQATNHAPNNS